MCRCLAQRMASGFLGSAFRTATRIRMEVCESETVASHAEPTCARVERSAAGQETATQDRWAHARISGIASDVSAFGLGANSGSEGFRCVSKAQSRIARRLLVSRDSDRALLRDSVCGSGVLTDRDEVSSLCTGVDVKRLDRMNRIDRVVGAKRSVLAFTNPVHLVNPV